MNFPAIIVIVVIGCLILWPFIICCRIKIFKEQAALKTALTKPTSELGSPNDAETGKGILNLKDLSCTNCQMIEWGEIQTTTVLCEYCKRPPPH